MDLLALENLLVLLQKHNVTFFQGYDLKLIINAPIPDMETEETAPLLPVSVFPDGVEPKFSGE